MANKPVTKRYLKKKPTSKSMNKLAIRKNLKMSVGSSRRGPLHFHVVHDVLYIPPATTDYSNALPLNPTTSQRWDVYSQLYDSYRIMSVTFDFIPDITVSNTAFDPTSAPPTISQFNQGITFLKYDKDDGTVPAGLQQCIIENYADRPSMKRFRFKLKVPKHTMSLDDGTVAFGYHSCQDLTKIDGWLKTYISSNPNVSATFDQWRNGYNIVVKYLIAFKDYHYKAPASKEPVVNKTVAGGIEV